MGEEQIRDLIRDHHLTEAEAPADGNCMCHAFKGQLDIELSCMELRALVAANAHHLGILGAGEQVMIDTKIEAEEGISAMLAGEQIPHSAWGGGESACVLAHALGIQVLNYDESSEQIWPHNAEAAANGIVRLLHLN